MNKKTVEKICFVVNPKAASGKAHDQIEWIWRSAQKRWDHVSLFLTNNEGIVSELSHGQEKEYDMIVACGGDGTIHRVINQFADSGVPFGVLPLGSGNDFVKSCNLPSKLSDHFDMWLDGTTRSLDLVKISGDVSGWAVNTIGLGLDGMANYYAHKGKIRPGTARYTVGAILAALRSKVSSMTLHLDGKEIREDLLMATICNGKIEGGSFHLSPDSELFDGRLELATLSHLPFPKLLLTLPKFKNGAPPTIPQYKLRPFQSLTIQSRNPLHVHADGEHLGSTIRSLTLEVVPGKVELSVPQ